jgi:hypothetical protein
LRELVEEARSIDRVDVENGVPGRVFAVLKRVLRDFTIQPQRHRGTEDRNRRANGYALPSSQSLWLCGSVADQTGFNAGYWHCG